MYVSILGKLTKIHLHAWLFSNLCGKVLIIVGISWSPDLRVQRKMSDNITYNFHQKNYIQKMISIYF